MRLFPLLIIVLFLPQGSYCSPESDTAAPAINEQFRNALITRTGPWLNRRSDKDPLSQNQPNPASIYTIIYFYVAKTGPVSLKLYDLRGELIGYFVDGPGIGGTTYRVFFPVGILAAGEYFYCFRTSDFSIVKKMVVAR